jgi:hypothetical protein
MNFSSPMGKRVNKQKFMYSCMSNFHLSLVGNLIISFLSAIWRWKPLKKLASAPLFNDFHISFLNLRQIHLRTSNTIRYVRSNQTVSFFCSLQSLPPPMYWVLGVSLFKPHPKCMRTSFMRYIDSYFGIQLQFIMSLIFIS